MKKLNSAKLYTMLAAITTMLAASIATSACYWYYYQPEEPKSLRGDE